MVSSSEKIKEGLEDQERSLMLVRRRLEGTAKCVSVDFATCWAKEPSLQSGIT